MERTAGRLQNIMKFNKNWVDEWVANDLGPMEFADMITMAGLEVDSVSKVAGEFTDVVTAQVVECRDHPDSNKLHIAMVDCGADDLLQIVCGAPNCRTGMKTALAKTGAVLPEITIKVSAIRGVESHGMLCSYRELGMLEESDGIIELPDDAPVGVDLHDYMRLDDSTIDVDLTTNRPDCLGVRGIARETAVLTCREFVDLKVPDIKAAIDDVIDLEIENPDACPRYLCRIVKGVDQSAKSPVWMTEKLRRCGVRSVSPIVDVTNYVMLELGQPLHAFDLGAIDQKIVVRNAKEGEKLTVLSGEEMTLRSNTLVIADASKALGIAGIFGGLSSGISEKTVDVLLESAFFSPDAIKGRARQYGLATDASHRFERGVDPALQRLAIERAAQLLLEIGGGRCGPVVEKTFEDKLPLREKINLRVSRLAKVLGKKIPFEECLAILGRLGMNPVRLDDDTISAIAPSFRFDITIEEDLIEEIARVYGYDRIDNVSPVSTLTMGDVKEECLKDQVLRAVLSDLGYNEAITYSFTDPKSLKSLGKEGGITLTAPISSEMSVMRTTLLSGLLNAVKYNLNRQQKRIRLFETGLRYLNDPKAEFGILQQETLSGVVVGDVEDESWGVKARTVDFFDVKGDVEALIAQTANEALFEFKKTTESCLHPGQGADIYFEGQKAGFVGMLHPLVQKELGFKTPVGVFEIDKEALSRRRIPEYRALSKFPSIRRDFAFVINKDTTSRDLVEVVKKVCGSLLVECRIFDVFESSTLEGGRSVAVGVVLQDTRGTLDDETINKVHSEVIAAVQSQLGAKLRA